MKRHLRHVCLFLAAASANVAALAQTRFGQETGASYNIAVTSYRDIPFRTVVRQQFDYSCGSAALATLLRYHYGLERSEHELFQAMYAAGDHIRIRKAGFSLFDMKRYLQTQGLSSDGYRLNWPQLAALRAPAIAMVTVRGYRHFVVIKGIRADAVLVGDPAAGLRIYSKDDFLDVWNGVIFGITQISTTPVFNADHEWRTYRPTPWGVAQASAALPDGLSREGFALYQISPVLSLNELGQ